MPKRRVSWYPIFDSVVRDLNYNPEPWCRMFYVDQFLAEYTKNAERPAPS